VLEGGVVHGVERSSRNTREARFVWVCMLRRRHWVTLALLTVAGISFAVMQTLVIPALPFFRREFGASQADTTWLVTGFLLSSSVLTPLLGKLGDMYARSVFWSCACLCSASGRWRPRSETRWAGSSPAACSRAPARPSSR
jgi:MFS family permease